MAKRVQSPSSIKTYKHCPRKYYYSYILKLPTPPNIHQVRGTITHSVLEKIFDIDTKAITMDDYQIQLKIKLQKMLLTEWENNKEQLEKLQLTKEDEIGYFEDTMLMLFNWSEMFSAKIEQMKGTFEERFTALKPEREQMISSETYQTRGIIDVIEKNNGKIRLMDYKTSKSQEIDEHILQLAIYSLLYFDKHGKLPEQVGVYFLKGEEVVKNVDKELLEFAKNEIKHVHSKTETEDINDYPKSTGPLCKWSTGKCEFYDICKPFE